MRGHAVLGEEDFADRLVDHLRKKKDIPDIRRSKRFVDRPGLDKLFSPRILRDRQKRDRMIAVAVERHGFTQRSIARHLGLHYSYSSIILRDRAQTETFNTRPSGSMPDGAGIPMAAFF